MKYMAEAREKSKSKGSWFSSSNPKEEAADLYAKAANAFKLDKKYKEAGDAFMSQGEMLELVKERFDACTSYLNASKCYKKDYPKEAINALQLSISILVENGRFSTAANNQKQIAEIYETEIVDFAKCIQAYEKAAEWYSSEDSFA